MDKATIPGYQEVLDLFEQYREQKIAVGIARDVLASLCLRQTALIKNDKHNENAYYGVSALQRFVETREELNDQLNKRLDKYVKLENDILWLLDNLEPPHLLIITLRYIHGLDWLDVVHQMKKIATVRARYSERSCKRYRNEAISKLAPHYVKLVKKT